MEVKPTPARTFVRSLNILLKFARLYGFDHVRTNEQFETCLRNLEASLPPEGDAGLLIGAAGAQLLIDSVAIEGSAPEKAFAQLLSNSGVASIQFSRSATRDDLARLIRSFPSGRDAANAGQWKEALAGTTGIRVNEVRFVAEDASRADTKVAAQLIARTLGAEAGRLRDWLNNPQKLIELIAAAEGSKAGTPGTESGVSPTAGSANPEHLKEDELMGVMRLFGRMGQSDQKTGAPTTPETFQEHLAKLPESAQATLRQALAGLAAQAPASQPEEPVLVRLAEHLAIRFALERYERGEVRVNSVRQIFDRLGREIENLRKILSAHEDKMSRAGMRVEPHADILDRQFWAAVPEAGKRGVLLSPDAWCIPARNVRQYVDELRARADASPAEQVLTNYVACIRSEDAQARHRTALGLAELAELYGRSDEPTLIAAIRAAGAQLMTEREAELQSRISEAFVRLGQEAIKFRAYAAIQQVIASLDGIENQRPAFAQSLRPRIGIESRAGEFIEEALRTQQVPQGLGDVLRLMPRLAADQLLRRFNRFASREESGRLAELARTLGSDAHSHLREVLRAGPDAEAPETVGLLSHLEADAVEKFLPGRMRGWTRSVQDRVIRQLAASATPETGRVLLALLDHLDPLILTIAVDELGMLGEATAVPKLLRLAQGELRPGLSAYLRIVAIEALGRLRAREAVPALRQVLEAKQMWRWTQPAELRIAAAQALEKIDPEWTRAHVSGLGLTPEDLSFAPLDPVPASHRVRQRRYARLKLTRPLAATTSNLADNFRLEIRMMNLGGGLGVCERHIPPGTVVTLKLGPGLRPIKLQALVRSARTQAMGFEVADMDLEDRARLRCLLLELAPPESRSTNSPDSSAEKSSVLQAK